MNNDTSRYVMHPGSRDQLAIDTRDGNSFRLIEAVDMLNAIDASAGHPATRTEDDRGTSFPFTSSLNRKPGDGGKVPVEMYASRIPELHRAHVELRDSISNVREGASVRIDDVERSRFRNTMRIGEIEKHMASLERSIDMRRGAHELLRDRVFAIETDPEEPKCTSPAGSTVYDEILAERDRQDAKWGGPTHDDAYSQENWLNYIASHNVRAAMSENPFVYRKQLVRIAALAVAAVESCDRKKAAGELP